MTKNRIKELRKAKGLTLSNLVESLVEKGVKVNESQLSKFEKGTSSPRNDEIWEALAEIFNTDKLYVMGFSDIKPPSNPKHQLAEIDREIQEIEEILKNNPKEDDKEILEENKKELLSFRSTIMRVEKNTERFIALQRENSKLDNDIFEIDNKASKFILGKLDYENRKIWLKIGYALLDSQKLKEASSDKE
ncbi:hypothetical protein [Lactococcus lactis]|uniref:hypothetical protein n=1 Tax=Lactococcus lactis TaxID=1358 RepID=UPI00288F1BBC|nr:hypothetical protein [Lactococcus lactis]MDT2855906.1 hypothetical protein [Lactococcus lactis]